MFSMGFDLQWGLNKGAACWEGLDGESLLNCLLIHVEKGGFTSVGVNVVAGMECSDVFSLVSCVEGDS